MHTLYQQKNTRISISKVDDGIVQVIAPLAAALIYDHSSPQEIWSSTGIGSSRESSKDEMEYVYQPDLVKSSAIISPSSLKRIN